MDRKSPYYTAHLVVSAVRVLEHKKGTPPTVGDISELVGLSLEEIQSICNSLRGAGALEAVESAAGQRFYPGDPAPLESLPRERNSGGMEDELKKFEEKKRAEMEKFAQMTKKEDSRKKDLFSSLEAQLKDKLKKGE
ncbi:MAG: hypothetical protein ACLFOY_19295 [Desulfatibacillaceae bacterium]